MDIVQRIVKIAEGYVGIKEIGNNKYWNHERFSTLMKHVGHKEGQAWCAYFVELVWRQAYAETYAVDPKYTVDIDSKLEKTFSGSAVETLRNFKNSPFSTGKEPKPGSIAIWQRWTGTSWDWRGHAGIVVENLDNNQFKTVEGNTNGIGSREGDGVYTKLRHINLPKSGVPSLILKEFIYPVMLKSKENGESKKEINKTRENN